MRLIELYIQEVTRRLPVKSRAAIALELQSTINGMLPENHSEEDIKRILAKLGNPAVMASRYLNRPMYLIGPRYFDVYITLLKKIVPIAIIITLISILTVQIVSSEKNDTILNIILDVFSQGISASLTAVIQVFFWLTLVFVIIERTDKGKDPIPLTMKFKEWTPDDLKNIRYIVKEKRIPKAEVFFSFLWIAIWVSLYFNASALIGVYEQGKNGVEFMVQTFNQDVLMSYAPLVVIVSIAEVAFNIQKWLAEKWTLKLAIGNTLVQVLSVSAFMIILSNSNLFNSDFIFYLKDLFKTTKDIEIMITRGAMFFMTFFAMIDLFNGFRKAKI
ncbi:hypothetical protein [Bacillus sp. T3]|uniref:hypothetical protein n=1 Tax=Bacillus sp. T3 TaxID=467262 RepID=UPI002982237A|nr:hypothetical protein [Bacillus sp. T3]